MAEIQDDHPDDACLVPVRGDFLFHCHLEEHMMAGLAGLIRSRAGVWLTHEAHEKQTLPLPVDGCEDCAAVDGRRTCTFPISRPRHPRPTRRRFRSGR